MSSLAFVGCNNGQDVRSAVQAFEHVWLFDPLPDVCMSLAREFYSAEYMDKSVHIINAACWSDTEPRTLYIYNERGLSSSLGQVTQQSQAAWLERGTDLQLKDEIEVRCVQLGEYLPGWLDKLIIDAQGADLEILKSIEPWLLAARIGSIQIECDGAGVQHYDLGDNSEDSMKAYMSQFSYAVERVADRCEIQPDLLFKRLTQHAQAV